MLDLAIAVVDELWSSGKRCTSDKGSVASGTVLLINVGADTGKKEENLMSSISGVGSFGSIQRDLNVASRAPVSTGTAADNTAAALTDRVELSGTTGRPDVSGYVARLKLNDVRTDKVADIRSQLDAGTYETDQKLNTAVDRLLGDLHL